MSEYLRKKDPSGYYVLVFKSSILDKLKNIEGLSSIETYGDSVIVRVKSRSLAKKLIDEYMDYLVK